MKSNKKLIAVLTTLALILAASIFSTSVFAEADNSADALLDSAAPVVSGCDLKKEDLKLTKINLTGFQMLLPKGNVLTIETPAAEFAKSEVSRNELINEGVFLYFRTNAVNACVVYGGMEKLNDLEKYYGDYSKLTKEEQKEILSQQIMEGDETSKGRFEKINGRTYLVISKNDVEVSSGTKYVYYALTTVIGDYKYIVQLVAYSPNKNDIQVINQMLNSVRVNGMSEPFSVLEIALIVCVVILLLAVGFMVFLFIRMNAFARANQELPSVIGFEMPVPTAEDDDSDDLDDDDQDYDDFEEEEPAEPEEEEEEFDATEKIIDD